MSQADCQAIWNNADANSDGKMDGLEAKPFIDAMIAAKEKSMDSKGKSLQSREFLKSCQAGTFDSVKLYHSTSTQWIQPGFVGLFSS
jgi:hypothetical protein